MMRILSRKMWSLMGRVFHSNFRDLTRPYRLNFVLTYQCNLKCQICNIWKKRAGNELTAEEIELFFKKNNYFSWIDITGGELFLRKDLERIVRVLVAQCPNLYLLHFPTNGFMSERIVTVTREILSYFKQKLMITISLDGPADLHDSIRGGKGSWERSIAIFKALKEIRRANLEVYFGMTFSDKNVSLFRETFNCARRLIPQLGYEDIHFNFIHNSGHYYEYTDARIGGDPRYLDALEEILLTRKSSWYPVHLLEKEYLCGVREYLKTGRGPCLCEALSSSVFVAPEGSVYACSIWDKKIGNLRETEFDLSKIIQSQESRRLRLQIKKKDCPGCWTPCEAYTAIMAHKMPFSK